MIPALGLKVEKLTIENLDAYLEKVAEKLHENKKDQEIQSKFSSQ